MAKSEGSVAVFVRLPASLFERLDIEAEENDMTRPEVVKAIVAKHYQMPLPRRYKARKTMEAV